MKDAHRLHTTFFKKLIKPNTKKHSGTCQSRSWNSLPRACHLSAGPEDSHVYLKNKPSPAVHWMLTLIWPVSPGQTCRWCNGRMEVHTSRHLQESGFSVRVSVPFWWSTTQLWYSVLTFSSATYIQLSIFFFFLHFQFASSSAMGKEKRQRNSKRTV